MCRKWGAVFVAMSLLGLPADAQAARKLIVPMMRFRPSILPEIPGTYIYRKSADYSFPALRFNGTSEDVTVPEDTYAVTYATARYRIELSNLSNTQQRLKLSLREGSRGELFSHFNLKCASQAACTSDTITLAARGNFTAFIDFTCDFGSPRVCEVNYQGGAVNPDDDPDGSGSATTWATKTFTKADVTNDNIYFLTMGFRMALDIDIEEDRGAISGVLGTIFNYGAAPIPVTPAARPRFRFSREENGASGAMPLNGGRPF